MRNPRRNHTPSFNRNCSIDRHENTLENVCIKQPGDGRDGLFLARSDTTVRNADIDVDGEPIVAVDADVTTDRVREDGNCPLD